MLINRAYQPFLVPQCVQLRFDSFRVGRAILWSFVGGGSGGRKSGRWAYRRGVENENSLIGIRERWGKKEK